LYWLGAALAAAALLIAGVDWYRSQPFTTTRLLQRLPADNALILSVDFRALRRAGILQMLDGSRRAWTPNTRPSCARPTSTTSGTWIGRW
jgi:uncharacterized membrane protein (DUF441 family)